MTCTASPGQVWDALMFYETIPRRPPFYLRLLLPGPKRSEGRRSVVGDEILCVYETGHLLKRVMTIDPTRHYGFDVVEQDLAIGRGIRLIGGSYTLHEFPDGSTRLGIETLFVSPVRPRWLWMRIEAAVCHAFHRHILGAMRREAESQAPGPDRPGQEKELPSGAPEGSSPTGATRHHVTDNSRTPPRPGSAGTAD